MKYYKRISYTLGNWESDKIYSENFEIGKNNNGYDENYTVKEYYTNFPNNWKEVTKEEYLKQESINSTSDNNNYKFKEGDEVICIDDSGMENEITLNKVYKIQNIGDRFIAIINNKDKATKYYFTRFKLFRIKKNIEALELENKNKSNKSPKSNIFVPGDTVEYLGVSDDCNIRISDHPGLKKGRYYTVKKNNNAFITLYEFFNKNYHYSFFKLVKSANNNQEKISKYGSLKTERIEERKIITSIIEDFKNIKPDFSTIKTIEEISLLKSRNTKNNKKLITTTF